MSEIQQRIKSAIKDAMRAKEKDKLGVLRMITSEFKRIEVDERIDLNDERVLVVLDKMIKQRRESAKQYTEAGREELANTEHFEIELIQSFLPTPLSAEEIDKLIDSAIEQSGAQQMADMGKVMAIIKPIAQGRADIGAISKQIKARLSS